MLNEPNLKYANKKVTEAAKELKEVLNIFAGLIKNNKLKLEDLMLLDEFNELSAEMKGFVFKSLKNL